MNKTLISVLLAAAAIFMVSCSDDDTPGVPQIADITFVAHYPSFNSDLISPQWRELESMMFFSEDETPARAHYVAHSDKPTSAAEFRYRTGGDITLWTYFAAFHGYGYGRLDNFEAEVYKTQKYVPNATDAEEDMMITPARKVSETDFSQSVALDMQRISAVAAVRIIDATSENLLNGQVISRLTLDTGDDSNNFAGKVRINFYDATSEIIGKCTPKEAVSTGNNVVRIGDAGRVMMNVLPVALKRGSEIEVGIVTDRYSLKKMISTEDDISFGKGMLTELTLKITDNDLTD